MTNQKREEKWAPSLRFGWKVQGYRDRVALWLVSQQRIFSAQKPWLCGKTTGYFFSFPVQCIGTEATEKNPPLFPRGQGGNS